jgi:hypothetical protein
MKITTEMNFQVYIASTGPLGGTWGIRLTLGKPDDTSTYEKFKDARQEILNRIADEEAELLDRLARIRRNAEDMRSLSRQDVVDGYLR